MKSISVVHDRLVYQPGQYLDEARKILEEMEKALLRLKQYEDSVLFAGALGDGGRTSYRSFSDLKLEYNTYDVRFREHTGMLMHN